MLICDEHPSFHIIIHFFVMYRSWIALESADTGIPVTGLLFPAETSADSADYMPFSAEKELIDALEMDDQVTGTCTVEVLVVQSIVIIDEI